MDLRQIVSEWLKANGYAGLYSDCECACTVDDLMPCDMADLDCQPGYLCECPPDCGEHEYHISAVKPAVEEVGRGKR